MRVNGSDQRPTFNTSSEDNISRVLNDVFSPSSNQTVSLDLYNELEQQLQGLK